MEVLFFEDELKYSAAVIHEPISRIAATNGDHFRVYIRFLKNRAQLPRFGLLNLDIRNIRSWDGAKVAKYYLKMDNDITYDYRNKEVFKDDIFVINFHVASKQNKLNVSFRMNFIFLQNGEFSTDNWSEWSSSHFPIAARLLIEVNRSEVQIFNGQAFDLLLMNRFFFETQEIECDVCLTIKPDIIIWECGHGVCQDCYKKLETMDFQKKCHRCTTVFIDKTLSLVTRNTICPIDACKQPKDAKYAFSPCGCMIYHHFEKYEEQSLVGTKCPYRVCSMNITNVLKVYIDERTKNELE